jgi:hypothetical protein
VKVPNCPRPSRANGRLLGRDLTASKHRDPREQPLEFLSPLHSQRTLGPEAAPDVPLHPSRGQRSDNADCPYRMD